MWKRVAVAAVMVVAFGVASAWADGFPGVGAFSGTTKLKVSGCGKAKEATTVDVSVTADGAWVAGASVPAYGGSGRITGKGRRLLVLEPDTETIAALAARLESDGEVLCGSPLTVSDVTLRKGRVKVSGKGTQGRLLFVVKAAVVDGTGRAGNAKLRLGAGGAWDGPLTCEEVFACTELCAQGDATCVDGCLSKGTLATQDAARALMECVDAACPNGDPVCIATAIGGVCKEEFETCVPPPPPTNLTCEEVLDCANECGGQRCVDDCFRRGSEKGRAAATDVAQCLGAVCPGGGAACEASALAYACAYLWEDCSGTSPPRNFGCGQILSCQATCGGVVCRADCFDRGSASGQGQLETLDSCISSACPTRDPVCVGNTVTGQCKTEWELCLG